MNRLHPDSRTVLVLACFAALTTPERVLAQPTDQPPAVVRFRADVLTPARWREVDAAVTRARAYLATQQTREGSFGYRHSNAQPAITGLATMAMLSCGAVPGDGPEGARILKAVDFVLSTQSRAGMFSVARAEPYIARPIGWDEDRAHALYNHAIAGILLGEVYGMLDAERNARVAAAVKKALAFSRKRQTSDKFNPKEYGGWRYMFVNAGMDADLSVTSWQLMFYRSARNAGFDVPEEYAADAMEYVRRCFDERRGAFYYSVSEKRLTRAMNGAGILSLALGGEHQSAMAQRSGDWILRQSFERYNTGGGFLRDQYHYSVYYCTLGVMQLGGERWDTFYPRVVDVLLRNQRRSGGWAPEHAFTAGGSAYTTSLCTMALTAPYQLIPIYQR